MLRKTATRIARLCRESTRRLRAILCKTERKRKAGSSNDRGGQPRKTAEQELERKISGENRQHQGAIGERRVLPRAGNQWMWVWPLPIIEFFYEAALLDFTQQAVIDERFGIGGFRFRNILFDETEHGFDAAQRRIGNVLVVFGD